MCSNLLSYIFKHNTPLSFHQILLQAAFVECFQQPIVPGASELRGLRPGRKVWNTSSQVNFHSPSFQVFERRSCYSTDFTQQTNYMTACSQHFIISIEKLGQMKGGKNNPILSCQSENDTKNLLSWGSCQNIGKNLHWQRTQILKYQIYHSFTKYFSFFVPPNNHKQTPKFALFLF